jgi:hypothetical protein
MLWQPKIFRHNSSAAGTPHKVHIAFGMHVNLYHSFRGDTNDENGFGQDIRVIRQTIRELDRFNRAGIPVSAVWDFDNLFSLQEILPVYAPDIIGDVQRRVKENSDEVILMSYNNGLVSAMNHPEFIASIKQAVANEKGSGVYDLFGRRASVVRPQEMMTTTGNFERYRAMGIQYVSLYYSATPFDAFRMFSRQLTPTEAHNPITYLNPKSGEEIGIIPTYHAGDLVEQVSLRNWAERLHRLQVQGKIDRDVLIFINFDADAEFWSGANLPWHLDWLPNTGGFAQLVDSVADLDFVTFSNLTDYLAVHPPAGEIYFSQDTADGSFGGYNSWAEKAYASDYWTRIVRNRRAHQMARKVFTYAYKDGTPSKFKELFQRSFETRMRALSTTNFGLATPFLARQREAAMASLLERLDRYTSEIEVLSQQKVKAMLENAAPSALPPMPGDWIDTFLYLTSDIVGDRFLEFRLPKLTSRGQRYFLADSSGNIIPASLVKRRRHADGRNASIMLRVSKDQKMPEGIYFLFQQSNPANAAADEKATLFAGPRILKNQSIRVHFCQDGHVASVTRKGIPQLDPQSLIPYIVYAGRRITPQKLSVTVEEDGRNGIASVRIHGPWNGPPGATRAPGWVDYHLRLLRDRPYLFIEGEVRYPDTYRHEAIQIQKPVLARKIDPKWEEVAPMELRFSARSNREDPFFIHKRNFLGRENAYPVDYFRHSPKNLNVASINNHITSEYTAVTAAGRGMAVAMNTRVNANFAFCPYKMEYRPATDEFAIRANPFGTYHGDQIVPPTKGNRLGYKAVLLAAPQLHSAGPTYNGYHDRFELMVSFFDGDTIPGDVKRDLVAFARRPLTIGTRTPSVEMSKPKSAPTLPPAGFLAMPYKSGVLFLWDNAKGPEAQYRIRYRALSDPQETSFNATGSTLFVDASSFSATGGLFLATIAAVDSTGYLSKSSPPIQFRLTQERQPCLDIPTQFKAKIIWASVNAWIRRYLL